MAGMSDFLGGAQNIFGNPLFMAGANIYQGAPVAQSMALATKTAQAAAEQKRQDEMRKAWAAMIQGGGVPKTVAPYLPFLGPQQGAAVLAQNALSAPDRANKQAMDAARLQLMKAQIGRANQPQYITAADGTVLQRTPDGKLVPAYQAGPKPPSTMDAARILMLQRMGLIPGGQPAPAQPPQPQVQPQSFDGAPVVTDPNFIQAQTAAPGSAAPAAPPQPPASPLGNLTPEQRSRLGFSMMFPGAGNVLGGMETANAWTKPTANKIDEKIFNTTEQAARLQQIRSQFKPEYLTIGGGSQALWSKWREKILGGGTLGANEKQFLAGYSQFKQTALSNINQYIKEITGAQMSEKEADRIRQAMPDPGEGVLDGNAPTEFKAKLDNATEQLTLAAARYNYLRSGKWKGGVFTGDINNVPITLDQMRGIINERGKAVMREMKMRYPNAAPDILREQAKARVKQEFGI